MLDLKNCPFCGGKAEWANGLKGDNTPWRYIACEVCEATAPYPGDEPAAWNRRAQQAVGPEPAVDYHGLLDDAAFWIEGALKCKEWNWSPDQFDAASDCLSSIRSALVATPPAASEIVECLLAGKPFVFDPATNFCHADDGGAPEHGIKYVPATPPAERVVEADAEPANCISFDTKDRLVGALRTAIDHIEHMSAFLSKLQAGYSFEGIGEDMPNLRDALASATSSDVTKYPAGVSSRDHIAHDMKIGRFPRQSSIDTFLRERALAAKPAVKDDETVVEALPNWTGWRSIDTAPEDCRVLLATAGSWVGEAIMLRDEDTGEQVWTWVDTGKPSLHSCYGWMPLPEHLLAPVLSDLRPDGFDGPTGAE